MAKSKKAVDWKNHFIELLVVIIGISIAFAIEQWSEQRKEKVRLFENLQGVIDDLTSDAESFDESQIILNQQALDDIDYILEKLNDGAYGDEALEGKIPGLFSSNNSTIATASYEALLNSGRLEQIEDMKLRNKLVSHFGSNRNQLDFITDWNIEYSNKMMDYVTTHSETFYKGIIKDEKLMRDIPFRNMVYRWRGIVAQKVRDYRRVSEESKRLAEEVEHYIATH